MGFWFFDLSRAMHRGYAASRTDNRTRCFAACGVFPSESPLRLPRCRFSVYDPFDCPVLPPFSRRMGRWFSTCHGRCIVKIRRHSPITGCDVLPRAVFTRRMHRPYGCHGEDLRFAIRLVARLAPRFPVDGILVFRPITGDASWLCGITHR